MAINRGEGGCCLLGEGNIKMRIRDPRMTASGANDLYQASQPACNGRGLLIVIWKWIVNL